MATPTPTCNIVLLFHTFLIISIILTTQSAASLTTQPKQCSQPTGTTCNSHFQYTPPNTTALSSIQTLFSLGSLTPLLSANNLPLSTSSNHKLAANHPINIPFSCLCRNGIGISDKTPIYTVQKGDTLDHIASDVFSRLVDVREIMAVNDVVADHVNAVEFGQQVWIPLPCSCDRVAFVVDRHGLGGLFKGGGGISQNTVPEIIGSEADKRTKESSLLVVRVLLLALMLLFSV